MITTIVRPCGHLVIGVADAHRSHALARPCLVCGKKSEFSGDTSGTPFLVPELSSGASGSRSSRPEDPRLTQPA